MLLKRAVTLSKTIGRLGEVMEETLNAAKTAGTYKTERVMSTAQGSHVKIVAPFSKSVVNVCANNYLGLSADPQVKAAAKKAIDDFGFGMSSVRFICGTQTQHKQLESALAKFHGMEDCILFPSCFDANAGIFESLLTEQDAVISDELNHASIIDGIRLCKASRYRYKHLNLKDLREKLVESEKARIRLVVTDGVFSMDGDIAPLAEISKLCKEFPNTYLMVDEAHATGVLGATGRGTPEVHNVKVDIINSTLGKALGGASGGYTCANSDIIDLLRNKARPYLFSNSVPPSVVGASMEVLSILSDATRRTAYLDKLKKNIKYFRSHMHDAGFNVLGHDDCAICPVMVGDAVQCKKLSESLLERGVYAVNFSYPVVPKDMARIRVQISAAHEQADLSKTVAAFIGAGKELGVLPLYTAEAYEQKVKTHDL